MTKNNLSFSLEGSLINDQEVLFSNLKLNINLNKWTSIIGQSGSGKSTLLKVIAGMDLPKVFNNTLISSNTNYSFSWMAQNDLLLPWASVIENVTLGQKLRREKIDTKKGDLVIFPSSFLYPHEICKVTKGSRYSYVSWVW